MTWASDYGAQRVSPKSLFALGPKGLEIIYYFTLFSSLLIHYIMSCHLISSYIIYHTIPYHISHHIIYVMS